MNLSASSPLFSIVTVCFNPGELIRKTIESVLAQNTPAEGVFFEYIIQDGKSSDNTLSIVDSYSDAFSDKNINLIVNSEKDNGIYDAMNKAVKASGGKYVIFMNADDCFYNSNVLCDITESLKKCGDKLPDIIYGDCIVKELGMYFKFRKSFDAIKERMPFSHQACFADRALLLDSPFNTEYRITADYAFLLKSFLTEKVFFDSKVEIALVTADGLSSIHMLDTFIEANKVCNNLNCPRFTDEASYNKALKKMKLKQFVLSYFPEFIKLFIRKNQVKNRGQLTNVTVPPWCN